MPMHSFWHGVDEPARHVHYPSDILAVQRTNMLYPPDVGYDGHQRQGAHQYCDWIIHRESNKSISQLCLCHFQHAKPSNELFDVTLGSRHKGKHRNHEVTSGNHQNDKIPWEIEVPFQSIEGGEAPTDDEKHPHAFEAPFQKPCLAVDEGRHHSSGQQPADNEMKCELDSDVSRPSTKRVSTRSPH